MPSESLRKRLHLFIVLDGQKDNAPDTHTFIALKKLLGISPALTSDNSPIVTRENGCRVFHGFIENIPYSLYVKGDSLLSGKRYSILLFADVAHNVYLEENHHWISSILFLDCDTRTTGRDIQCLLSSLEKDSKCGGVTGFLLVENTVPGNIIILLQEFYMYFHEHIINKASDTLFNKCTLLHGGFSLIRYSAFRECLEELSKVPRDNDINMINRLELGEDRYITTLILCKEYKTKYIPEAVAKTVIPDTSCSFITQQRRWNQSILSNQIKLLFQEKRLLLRMSKMQFIQWFILFMQFIGIWTTLAVFSLIVEQGWYNNIFPKGCIAMGVWGYSVILAFTLINRAIDKIHIWVKCNLLIFTIIFNYGMICAITDLIKLQNYLTLILIFIQPILLLILAIKSSKYTKRIRLICGFACNYFLGLPISNIIYLYSFANLDNRSWGTRGVDQELLNQPLNHKFDNFFENRIYVKGSCKLQAAQEQDKYNITGFTKKMLGLILFLVINFVLIESMFMSKNFGFFVFKNVEIKSYFPILMALNLPNILRCLMSFLYHRSLGSEAVSNEM